MLGKESNAHLMQAWRDYDAHKPVTSSGGFVEGHRVLPAVERP